ncbi:MAG TPA: hypothetical protein PLJ27_00795, partial [Polyangiaceae bacterium]|nr:hypothetical protein [Polyangiaceae bacterium]
MRNFQASLVPVASTGNTCHDFSIWYGYPSDRYALPNFRRSRPWLAACGSDDATDDFGGAPDGTSTESSTLDATSDSSPADSHGESDADAHTDGGIDGEPDVGSDVATDVVADVATDVVTDVAADVVTDVVADVVTDV